MTDLRRHVPPIALAWDDETPGELWRVVDGTLVFADVSGFTALTEKLSRRGRIGAEEIVETLNRVFGPMLRIAGTRGGELLKFGGDALLFLFTGPDHTEQACDAAVEMRTALRQAAAVPTSVGRLSLKMSVGLHSGDIHLFLVGSPTRELLILGPGATSTALAEKAAEAGEIVVSAATAARLAPDAVRPREDGELLLRRRTAHSAPGEEFVLPDVDRERIRGLFPIELGEYLDPGIPDPEHRIASIAFIKFSGTDALLAGPGPRCPGRGAAPDRQPGRGGAGPRVDQPARHRPRQRRRQVLPRLGHPDLVRGQRGPDAARPAPDRGLRLAAAAAAGRQPRARLRRRGRDPRARRLHRHGRHHQHRRPDHVQGDGGEAVRPPGGPRALAHAVRRHSPPDRSR